jgi:hypothetical protein
MANPQEQAALQAAAEAHADVVMRFGADMTALTQAGLCTAQERAAVDFVTHPLNSLSVLVGKYRGSRTVVRSLSGNYFQVRGHCDTVATVMTRLATHAGRDRAAAAMTLFPNVFGGLTHSGLMTPVASENGVSAVMQHFCAPVLKDADVVVDGDDRGL